MTDKCRWAFQTKWDLWLLVYVDLTYVIVFDLKYKQLWYSNFSSFLPFSQYDKYYVGELPPKQVTFTNLNDNVREPFLREMCEKYGTVEDVTIYRHPKTGKHLGLATVSYSSTRSARNAVGQLNRSSVMGNIIIVQIDAGGNTICRGWKVNDFGGTTNFVCSIWGECIFLYHQKSKALSVIIHSKLHFFLNLHIFFVYLERTSL